MKDSIIEINFSNILNCISDMKKRNQLPQYRIMNPDTLKLMKEKYDVSYMPNSYSTIFGVKIAICETLKYGEFEIV